MSALGALSAVTASPRICVSTMTGPPAHERDVHEVTLSLEHELVERVRLDGSHVEASAHERMRAEGRDLEDRFACRLDPQIGRRSEARRIPPDEWRRLGSAVRQSHRMAQSASARPHGRPLRRTGRFGTPASSSRSASLGGSITCPQR